MFIRYQWCQLSVVCIFMYVYIYISRCVCICLCIIHAHEEIAISAPPCQTGHALCRARCHEATRLKKWEVREHVAPACGQLLVVTHSGLDRCFVTGLDYSDWFGYPRSDVRLRATPPWVFLVCSTLSYSPFICDLAPGAYRHSSTKNPSYSPFVTDICLWTSSCLVQAIFWHVWGNCSTLKTAGNTIVLIF